jgi:FAD/FMN-containing dehydrogenase
MLTTETIETDIRALRAVVEGDVVAPGDAGWDDARRAWNLAVDQRPAAVVFPRGPFDVAAVVSHARAHGLGVALQGTGHGAGARSASLEDTILVNNVRLTGFEVDPEVRVLRAQAGTLWGPVAEAAAEHGLAALAGSAKDVGVVGYTLGGGIGWLARKYGMAANSVRALEVVTADGEVRRIDHRRDPDLFWALRGGGGSFAAVTAVELELHPVGELVAGSLLWPVEQAQPVLERYLEWVETVPDELTSLGRLLHVPDLPFLPEPVRGRSFVAVELALLGSEAEAAALLASLRALPGLALDTVKAMPPSGLATVHQDPDEPVPGVGDGALYGPLTREAVEALLAVAADRAASALVSFELRHLGGALARPEASHGAAGALEASFAGFAVGVAPSREAGAAVERSLRRVAEALAPWATGRSFLNLADLPGSAEAAFPADTYRRLRAVKAAYDPGDVFRANRPVPPAA